MKLALTPLWRGILVGVVQLALVGSLACKLWYDRETLPRVWVRCTGLDPDDPLRGRYISLRLTVPYATSDDPYGPVRLHVQGDQLVAERVPSSEPSSWERAYLAGREREGVPFAILQPPVAVFLPEHVPDPTQHPLGEELWLEVTVPHAGPPRPIRVGIKRRGAAIVPLNLE